jgi:hypothetical protein
MGLQLANANTVIVARHFNPSVVNQLWLVENQLVGRDEFRPGCVFSDMLVNVTTQRFLLFVVPEQLQFTPLGDAEGHRQLAVETVGRLVETLPHTPYAAIGLNFTWHLRPEQADLAALSRSMFFVDQRALFQAFDSEDARFGGYLSKNALGCRMKLDVKPVIAQLPDDKKLELMQFVFNFHLDVSEQRTAVALIQGLLDKWNQGWELTSDIMQMVQGENP